MLLSAQSKSFLPVPHKGTAGPGRESPIRQSIPTAVGVPVIVAGIHTAIAVHFLNNGNMPQVACAFHIGLQHDNRWHLGHARNHPAGGGCSGGPLGGVPSPGNPPPSQLMVAQISPVSTFPKGKMVEATSCQGWR